jgi:peptide/nickel transport system permease protein
LITAAATTGRLPGSGLLLHLKNALRRMPPSVKSCMAIAVIITLAMLFAPWIAPHDPDTISFAHKLKPPAPMEGHAAEYLLGTDQLGRDLLSRTIHGIRVSVGIALTGLFIGCLIGTTLGIASGLIGGFVDRAIMMFVDVFITIPNLLIVMVGIAAFGNDTFVLIALIGIARWESYARVVRGQVLQVRELPFVEASRALGAGNLWIAIRHILPNIASPLLVLMTLNFPSILLLESSLSFLGLGVQPPTASLGSMVGDGRDHLIFAWWVAIVPAAAIVLITFVVQLLGDWLRDVLDVRTND